ncbi:hypothetical protein DL762_008762 [Monosporascus cannonballus]|uniref:Peptide hydrolase n=1 Tax=Monosporascus cannonballus TaxID=155416 RepID=A0ABY0GW83_9PEZI|nr:hypothetical protein DL762_008762 [Monosporascus cannonballus]RYO88112.1 hypothetical protein DL763_006135 [Monosporascus cannonballus]
MVRPMVVAALVATTTALTISRREATEDELSTIELAPGVTQVVTEDEKFALKNTTAPRSLVSKLSTVNMRSELTTFWGFYNRYYTSPYGKQASDWLLGEFRAVVSSSGATRASVKAFTRSKITAGQWADTLEFYWYTGEEAGLLGSGGMFDSYRSSGVVVKALAAAGHEGHTTTGYANKQCGYGCSDHASASVIEAAASRTSPYNHTDRDAVSTLNFSHTLEHAKLAIGYAYELTFASVFGKRRGEGRMASVIC